MNLNALKTALGVEALPTEVVKLAVTYLAQIDPRAALAVKALEEQEYNLLLANIEQQHPNDTETLKAAVNALKAAPDDAALFAEKPDVAETFATIDQKANLFEPSIGSVFKLMQELSRILPMRLWSFPARTKL